MDFHWEEITEKSTKKNFHCNFLLMRIISIIILITLAIQLPYIIDTTPIVLLNNRKAKIIPPFSNKLQTKGKEKNLNETNISVRYRLVAISIINIRDA